jgi:transposase InsO family protein
MTSRRPGHPPGVHKLQQSQGQRRHGAVPAHAKKELVWLRESWASPALFFAALDRWLVHYNASYLHSALGYPAPNAFEAEPPPRHSLSGSLLNREQYTSSWSGCATRTV